VGLPLVLLSPLLFPLIPLLGYAVEATRAAELDPSQGPPPWRLTDRLFRQGFAMFGAILLTWIPPYLFFGPLTGALQSAHVWQSSDPGLFRFHDAVLSELILALPFGILALLVLPHATARFAASGKARDVIDFRAAVRGVRRDFATWNIAVAAIVTAWAIGIACVGLFCIGLVPGIYYAILVSAHASATLQPTNPPSPAG
jgi:hypothetical protein